MAIQPSLIRSLAVRTSFVLLNVIIIFGNRKPLVEMCCGS